MRVEAIFFLAAFLLCVQCHFYTDSNADPGFKQHCEDDTCVTDERPCFIPREKGILTRLDGVKVSSCNIKTLVLFPRFSFYKSTQLQSTDIY